MLLRIFQYFEFKFYVSTVLTYEKQEIKCFKNVVELFPPHEEGGEEYWSFTGNCSLNSVLHMLLRIVLLVGYS